MCMVFAHFYKITKKQFSKQQINLHFNLTTKVNFFKYKNHFVVLTLYFTKKYKNSSYNRASENRQTQ